MRSQKIATWLVLGLAAALSAGCATQSPSLDYSAYRQSHPRSILILPPISHAPDVNASISMLSQMTQPLAEAGYYVLPVALVAETFKQNGLSQADEIQALAPAKLHEIFGADAGLYVTVDKYGASYTVLNSVAVVAAQARLVDLKTGTVLWTGSASASNDSNNNQGGGLVGLLVTAIVKQIVNEVTDASHVVAGVTSQRLLAPGRRNGLLYGPRSPSYGTDAQP